MNMAEEDAHVGTLESGVYEKQQRMSQPVAMPRKSDKKLIISANNYNTDLLLSNTRHLCTAASDSEEGFLSTSPDSANGEGSHMVNEKKLLINGANDDNLNKTTTTTTDNTKTLTGTTITTKPGGVTSTTTTTTESTTTTTKSTDISPPPPIFLCTNPTKCVTLKNILDSFKAPLSEEQAWALIYQFMLLYRNVAAAKTKTGGRHIFNELEIPDTMENLNLHHDGTVHCSWSETERKEKEEKFQQQQQMHNSNDDQERGEESSNLLITMQKQILRQIAVIVYTALDYNLQADEQCQMSTELLELITYMTDEENEDDCIDEGIDEGCRRWDDENEDDNKCCETKEFDFVLEACRNHIKPTVPEEHYKAVCRALVTESIELRAFLQQVMHDGTATLNLNADTQTTNQELAKLGFNDWARFWVQVIDELRRGVRLKKNTYERAPIEYELTPYEILMEDIRSKKYQLRKVMVNGDIPPRVKKDAHALILEFIRSRPPLKKASERQLPPPIYRTLSPREQLMDSIRKGQTLKHIPPPITPHLKDRLLPSSNNTMTSSSPLLSTTTATEVTKTEPSAMIAVSNNAIDSLIVEDNLEPQTTPRSKQRLIKVDFSLLQDDDTFFNESSLASTSACNKMGICSQPKMPPYPIGGYMVSNVAGLSGNSNNQQSTAHKNVYKTLNSSVSVAPQVPTTITNRVLRRTTYDLATQCESRRASLRRHTIVGCQSNFEETNSMPTSRPDSRQSDVNANGMVPNKPNTLATQKYKGRKGSVNAALGSNSSSSVGPWNKSFLDEKTWQERGDDRLSLTLEEIVHIRSVMTKAELEGLPVGVRVKEDVEKRKVCFLCLRTRFSIFGPWGIMCKLCQRTVCSKCYTKMRIPTEHFRNVPLVLISPSVLASPAGSSTPSPSHQAHYAHSSSTGNILDENFPKSLIERLLRSESERKARNSVGSAPSSPKHQRSNINTPNSAAIAATGASTAAMTSSYVNGNQIKPTQISIMSRSMEGPRSLPVNSPARTHSNSSTLDRKSKFSRAFTLSASGTHLSQDQKENVRGELVSVCNDCSGLVLEITRSSKQTRSSARNRALQNLTLDLSPVYK